MSPRDKVLTELLEALAAYLDTPTPARWEDHDAAADVQRRRAILVQVLLETITEDLRTHEAKPASGPGSLASLLGARMRNVQEYAAQPLPYEPYQQPDGAS